MAVAVCSEWFAKYWYEGCYCDAFCVLKVSKGAIKKKATAVLNVLRCASVPLRSGFGVLDVGLCVVSQGRSW